MLGKEQELLERDQTVAVLREEVMAVSVVTSMCVEGSWRVLQGCLWGAMQVGTHRTWVIWAYAGSAAALANAGQWSCCGHFWMCGCWVQLELEKKLRTLLTKEKEKAEEEAALAMGLCTGGSIF